MDCGPSRVSHAISSFSRISETVALVENTYLYPFAMTAERHREEIATYLAQQYRVSRGSFEVIEEEQGAIPMTMATAVAEPGSRITPIGLSGGGARPSSGYAFLRIQRQVRHLARQIAEGLPPDARACQGAIGDAKYRFFDTVFLRVLKDRPDLVPAIFTRMFAGASPESLVRFLSETSCLRDDLKIVAALPKAPFMMAAARSAPYWIGTPSGKLRVEPSR